jgi:hypothetical protein
MIGWVYDARSILTGFRPPLEFVRLPWVGT